MSFADDLKAHTAKNHQRFAAVVDGSVNGVEQSLVLGSPITGSPGQPEDLRDKFTIERGENMAVISTTEPSAPAVESGISSFDGHPIKFHSPVGGEHSLELTAMGFPKIVAEVVKGVANA